MPGLDDQQIIAAALLLVVVLFSGLVHGTLGLGFPMVATPCFALMMDMRSAILLTLLPTMAVNVASILRGGGWRHSIQQYWPLAVYVVMGAVFGTRLLIVLDPAPFKLLLAGIIVLYLNLHRVRRINLAWVGVRPGLAYFMFGVVAGFSAGTTNVMVPILIVLALELGLATNTMVQVFNMCFLAGKLSQTATFLHAGALEMETLLLTAPLALAGVAALVIGFRIRERVHAETYRAWLKKILYVIAAVLIVQYVAALPG